MAIIFDPIKPYLTLIKAGLVAVVVLATFIGGCNYGEALSAEDLADKDREISAASAELASARDALAKVNAEAERRKAEAEQAAKDAEAARVAALNAEKAMRERQVAFDKQLERARRNPTCAAVLDTDLRSTCGL